MIDKEIRVYYAGSSECFGDTGDLPATEDTPFHPQSPYAVSKTSAFWLVDNYRSAYNLFICFGILFNHESPFRSQKFVTQKIIKGLNKMSIGEQNELVLGNLNAKRDWGHAKDYVRSMWMTLQQDAPDDYVIATGKQYSIKDFIHEASKYFKFDIVWEGEGLNEIGIDTKSGKKIISTDGKYTRPSEVDSLLGDPSKADRILGWKPEIDFYALVKDMAEHEITKNQ